MNHRNLETAVRKRLPDHMLPAAIIQLPTIPIMPNGKVDRRALPVPDRDTKTNRAPSTLQQEILCHIFAEALDLDEIGIDDNFFTNGGHSLLAAVMISRIRSVFQVELPLRAVFESPTPADLALRLNGASTAQCALLRQTRLEQLPLSYAQRRLWFIDQLEGASTEYNMPSALRLRGQLDITALEQAVNAMIARHEILRTCFPSAKDEPVQVIKPALRIDLPVEDLSLMNEAAQRERVAATLRQEWEQAFDLARGPLLRMRVLRINQQEHLLIRNFHHIIFDGWSQTIFNRELMILYEAFREGLEPQLKPLPVQYADFTLWQLKRFEGHELSESLTYWKKQLAGIPEQLMLPKDRPRGSRQTFDADVFRAALTHGQTAGLKRLSRACQATPYMTLMSAFAALLQYYSGQNDIVVGSPVANRQDLQLENLIGCFVNTIALRADVNPRLSFRDLLLQVRQTALEAYLHQELPFERLVEELAPQRHLNTTPIYQVLFALQNIPVSAQQWKTLQVEGVAIDALRLHLDLEVYGWEHDGEIELHWLYNRELFDGGRIKQMALHFTRLIEAAAAAPDAPLYTLDILGDQERHQILVRWNQTQRPEAAAATMPELFEEQATRTPHTIAVVHESGQLTYAELNRRANRLASFLRRLSVGPEVRVGICLERSPELIVVLLAVFKAGGAYVPLDPGHPPERLRFILADAQVPVLLTSARLADEFEPTERLRILYIEQQQQALSLEPGENPPPLTTPDNAAYIIYTSGSTGKPKGVVVRRQALGNLLASMLEITGLDRPFTMPAITTISFDMAVPELYLPLIAGGTIVLVDRETARDGKLLRETMRATQVNVLQATPATWKLLLEAGWDEPLVVLCGADVLTWDIAKMLLNRATATTNLYGPTETTVWSTYQDFHADREQRSSTVAIGDPIGNTRLYVLSADMEPVPIGVFGELYIAGVGLARGYLNQPDLTAERFIADPHGAPGTRLYRTGDLAWRRSDGKLEFAGRADHQVKIRGFRIELGEIEAVLREHESVREAAVVVREDRRGEKHLVGFLVEREGTAADHAQLRNYLKQRLPGYMVPPVLVKLERLPLNPNGKIDRKSLPSADSGNADQEYVGPRSETERALAEIWSELLGVPQVGIHDNFFSRGGHSLLATRLVTRIAAILGAELPVRAVFDAPTIAELATYPQLGGRTRPPLTPQRRPDRIPLSYAQQRLWFIDQMEGSSAEYNLPQALRLRGELDQQALQRAIAAIVERHEILRTRFILTDGVPLQIIEPELHIPLRVEDLTLLEPTAQREYVMATIGHEWDLPFDLARGPLLRMQLLRLGRNDHVLVWTFHHIISDGWSQILFTRELMALYGAFHRGTENPLPPLPVQYADFTLWQRSWLNDDLVERESQYWKHHLEGMPEELRLPKDRPRPRLLTSVADFRRISLQPERAATIKRLGQENQATLYMVLLTAFTVLLSRYSGQDDLIVGSPIANRQEPQLEQLLGFFVNSLAMRVQVKPRQSVKELLAAVRTTALDAYLHQDLPFERLVQELAPQRSLNRTPIFQVLFALQNAPVQPLPTGDLQVEPVGGDNHRIHFDLEVHAWEQSRGLEFYWLYNRDLFDPQRMEQMARHYQQIIAAMVANPEAQVCDLEILDEAERRELVGEDNRTQRAYFRGCVHEMFEAQAALTPDAVAVRRRTEQYTYDALNRQAGWLAHHLRAVGISCGDRVGICMERSPEMPAALLGVLRAGGAYVPLDVSYPAERLKSMTEDSGTKLILTTRNELRFAEQTRQRVLLVDDQDARGLSGVEAPAPVINPEELAYVIYTSGSTGRPKGVAVSHRALSNYVCWANGAYYSAAGSGSPVVSSLSFDLTITSIFPALTLGKTIELQADVEELAEVLQGPGQYSLVKITPSHLKSLDGRQRHDGTAALIIGGEALFYEDIAEWMRPGRRVINEYGPTEATVGCCAYEAAPEDCAHGPVPIGKPIGNMQVYVLDRELKLVPPGVSGELYIGGAGLARGYLNQPALTAERFIPDALGGRAGSRLYRSGDLVSRRFDGNLEFLGRVDDQVKIRGFRIELGEVEAALSRHPHVLAAAVTVRERKPGDRRLVAYVAPRERALLTSGELRDYARRGLPEYMVPSHIHLMAKMPLSKNGKIDRRQLPAFEDEGELEPASATSGTETEEALAQIWSEALGLEQVGLDHNFFDLGGHSLLIPSLRLAIREKLHCDVSIVDFFVYPTVRSLARRLEQPDEHSSGVSDSEDRAARRRTYLWRRRERLED